MRKKIFGVAIMAAIAVTAGWNMSQSENELKLSDLALDNVEALAQSESGSEYHSNRHYDSVLNKDVCNGPGSNC